MPTPMRIRPPQRFTAGPDVRKRAAVSADANVAANAVANMSATIIVAAMPNAKTAMAVLPTRSVCAARPASRGPVQPKPAMR